MIIQPVSRRRMLKLSGVFALAIPILQACGGAPPEPTKAPAAQPVAQPAAPTATAAAAAPAAPTATAAAAAPAAATATTAPAAVAAPAGGKTALSIATQDGDALNWQRDLAKQWAEKNPNVDLRIDTVNYGESLTKTLTALAAGTLQDVVYSSCKWFPLPAFKGAYRAIDDYVKAKDPGLADFFAGTISNSKFEGKLYGLPEDFDNGNYSIALLNLDIFAAKGVTPPTDAWDVQSCVDTAVKLTDPAKKTFGTDYLCGTYYDFSQLAREWGTDIVSEDGKKFQFASDPKSTAAAKWATDIRAKYKAAPLQADVQGVAGGIGFASGKLAISFQGIYDLQTAGDAVGNKFKWDAVLFPKAMNGNRSYYEFSAAFSLGAKSKAPEKAYDLMVYETTKEAGIYAVVGKSHFAPSPRISVFEDPQISKIHPLFPRLLEWLKNPSGPTNFPLPGNLRYAELQDTWSNKSQALFYGDVPFDQGMKDVQDACQAILDKPRP